MNKTPKLFYPSFHDYFRAEYFEKYHSHENVKVVYNRGKIFSSFFLYSFHFISFHSISCVTDPSVRDVHTNYIQFMAITLNHFFPLPIWQWAKVVQLPFWVESIVSNVCVCVCVRYYSIHYNLVLIRIGTWNRNRPFLLSKLFGLSQWKYLLYILCINIQIDQNQAKPNDGWSKDVNSWIVRDIPIVSVCRCYRLITLLLSH